MNGSHTQMKTIEFAFNEDIIFLTDSCAEFSAPKARLEQLKTPMSTFETLKWMWRLEKGQKWLE